MEPITILTYIAISHYSCYVVSNFYDYCKFQYNFHLIRQELSYVNEKIDRVIIIGNNIEYNVKKLKRDLISKE